MTAHLPSRARRSSASASCAFRVFKRDVSRAMIISSPSRGRASGRARWNCLTVKPSESSAMMPSVPATIRWPMCQSGKYSGQPIPDGRPSASARRTSRLAHISKWIMRFVGSIGAVMASLKCWAAPKVRMTVSTKANQATVRSIDLSMMLIPFPFLFGKRIIFARATQISGKPSRVNSWGEA